MCFIAIIMAMLLVSTHACNARGTPGLRIFSKDVINNEETKVVHEVDAIETLPGQGMSLITFDGSSSTIKMQGSERNERSILESESQETEEPTNSAKEDESIEDAVVMDYVTPHRKSPIHNNLH